MTSTKKNAYRWNTKIKRAHSASPKTSIIRRITKAIRKGVKK